MTYLYISSTHNSDLIVSMLIIMINIIMMIIIISFIHFNCNWLFNYLINYYLTLIGLFGYLIPNPNCIFYFHFFIYSYLCYYYYFLCFIYLLYISSFFSYTYFHILICLSNFIFLISSNELCNPYWLFKNY